MTFEELVIARVARHIERPTIVEGFIDDEAREKELARLGELRRLRFTTIRALLAKERRDRTRR